MRNAATPAILAILLAGCASTQAAEVVSAPAAPLTGGEREAPDPARWTYASGEAAGASIQAWRHLADYAIAVSRQRKTPQSVPLGLPGVEGGIGTPSCIAADGKAKPFAAVFDVDETVLLNTGHAYWQAYSGKPYDPKEWDQWAKNGAGIAAPVPGAVTGLKRLREAGIAVIFNTNRNSDTAAGTIAAIEAAGLGPAIHRETLFLRGDDAMGGRKDGRRATIAAKYCVIALGGDNLGDFADVFNDPKLGVQERRALVARGEYAQLWGNGWFMVPNAAYGAWQKGTINDVFPPESRWMPAEQTDAPAIMDKSN